MKEGLHDTSMLETISESLDFDNPYLDDIEEDYLQDTELEFRDS